MSTEESNYKIRISNKQKIDATGQGPMRMSYLNETELMS